jgi:thioredoxin 2
MTNADSVIVRCASCGTRNNIPGDKIDGHARCGRCRTPLEFHNRETKSRDAYTLRCLNCKTRNRIPPEKLNGGGKCGKCGSALPVEALRESQPVMITDKNFQSAVLDSPLPVLLFCWAPWCPTCGAVAPIIDEFARDSKAKIRVGKLNVDANPVFAAKHNVLSVPYLFIFDNGQLKDSLPGGLPKHELMMKMAYYL